MEKMRYRKLALAASAVLAATTMSSPAWAHGGHRSCNDAAQAFIVANAQNGTAGDIASTQAQEGTLADTLAFAHAVACEPAP